LNRLATPEPYTLVKLAGGAYSVHSVEHRETFHPVIGPVAEAEALYVRQLRMRERMSGEPGEFVLWDVGLGAAANVLTVLRQTSDIPATVRVVSFDHTIEPLRFARAHAGQLGYFAGYEGAVDELIAGGRSRFANGRQRVEWELVAGDFPSFLRSPEAERTPKPHAILYDAFSPAKNPAMWTQSVFADVWRRLDPARPCSLATYSRSTMLRVSLLLAGFFVGSGHASGEKEETTIAANVPELITEPLENRWLERARKSTSAEPLWNPEYRQARLADETWERLLSHPQFARNAAASGGLPIPSTPKPGR
jgi:hypothetical protein